MSVVDFLGWSQYQHLSLTYKEPEINKLVNVVSGQCDEIQKGTIPTGVHTAKGPNLPQARKKEANPITKVIMEWFLVDIQKGMKIIYLHSYCQFHPFVSNDVKTLSQISTF